MSELVQFVSSSIASGVIGSTAYQGLKTIFGASFNKLSSYIDNNQRSKFEVALELLLENESTVKAIEDLMEGKTINDSFKRLENSEIDANLGKGAKVTDSFKDNINSSIKIK